MLEVLTALVNYRFPFKRFSSDAERVARFGREAEVLASLNHPNIAAIYGLEEIDGASCLVLELLDGETLADRLQRGPLPFSETLKIAVEVADALDQAHRLGIAHRDVKPPNIMLTKDRAKLLDFGREAQVDRRWDNQSRFMN